MIHETAIVDPSAKIGKGVHIGPYSVIGKDVEIGDGTWIGPHVVIQGPTKIGKDNKIFQFASLGGDPQDLKFKGEETYLEIGDRNTIRECCTFNRGTGHAKSVTRVGSDNLFMAYVHIAHDCEVGNHVIFANNASLAGHVIVEDYAILSGFSGVFQFCRVGAYSFAATNSVVIKDIPPFVKVSGYYAKPFGLNTVGMQRAGFSEEDVTALKRAYKVVYRQGNTVAKAIAELKKIKSNTVSQLIQFIENSATGIVR